MSAPVSHALAPQADPRYWLSQAQASFAAGDGAGALAAAEELTRRNPAHADAWCEVGNALVLLGRPESAVGAYQRCLALRPEHPAALANLGYLQLNLGRPVEALAALQGATRLDHGNWRAWRDLALTQECLAQFPAASVSSRQALALAPEAGECQALAWRLAPQWWAPLVGRRLRLEGWRAAHAPFIARCFATPDFMRRYHRTLGREQGDTASIVQRITASDRLSPVARKACNWVILRPGDDGEAVPLGLASLAAMDAGHRRAEFMIGFPEPPPPGLALEATLLVLEFAFLGVGLEKLTSAVYADNPAAQENTLGLGFIQEGLFRAHVRDPETGNRLDMFLNGMLRTDFLENPRLQPLRARFSRSSV